MLSNGSAVTTRTIVVPKQFHGKVIGSKAATKLDIESDYGVTITMPDRNSDSENVIIEGPTQTAVTAAENRIMDICGMKSGNVDALRGKLNDLNRQKDVAFAQAKNAPNGPQRDALYAKANALKEACDKEQMNVAQQIFKEKNLGYGLDQMDLHGLSVKEAEQFVNERLGKVHSKLARNDGEFVLSIITGFGHHSDNQVAKIKPAIIELLAQKQYRFQLDASEGTLLVDGVTTNAVPQSTAAPKTTARAPAAAAAAAKPAPKEPEQGSNFGAIFGLVVALFTACFSYAKKR